MNVQISCINKVNRHDPYDAIDNFGGLNADGSRWKADLAKMINWIETGTHSFYVKRDAMQVKVIIAVSPSGNKYLKTEADNATSNNLLSLPECP